MPSLLRPVGALVRYMGGALFFLAERRFWRAPTGTAVGTDHFEISMDSERVLEYQGLHVFGSGCAFGPVLPRIASTKAKLN